MCSLRVEHDRWTQEEIADHLIYFRVRDSEWGSHPVLWYCARPSRPVQSVRVSQNCWTCTQANYEVLHHAQTTAGQTASCCNTTAQEQCRFAGSSLQVHLAPLQQGQHPGIAGSHCGKHGGFVSLKAHVLSAVVALMLQLRGPL